MSLIRRVGGRAALAPYTVRWIDPDEVAQWQGVRHGIENLIAIFREHGWPEWIPPIQVYPSPMTGEPFTLLDGHHRLFAAWEAGLPLVHAVVVKDAVTARLFREHDGDWLAVEEALLDVVNNVGWEHARDFGRSLK